MKKIVLDFIIRGLAACGFGPIILALLYSFLHHQGVVQTLTVSEVSMGILSLSALAFIVGGMNIIYQVEWIPLPMAILIHGSVLYGSYLGTYLLNGWLDLGTTPILVFSGIFVVTYLMIWAIIYTTTKKRTARLNEMLKEKQKSTNSK